MQLDIQASAEARREAASRADAALQALKGSTPAQIDAWVQAHVTTLAEARSLLAKMLYVLARLIP